MEQVLTEEQIYAAVEDKATTEIGFRRAANKLLREMDDSDLWPVKNQFNATERAIRRVRKFERKAGCAMYGLEYIYAVTSEIEDIVNSL